MISIEPNFLHLPPITDFWCAIHLRCIGTGQLARAPRKCANLKTYWLTILKHCYCCSNNIFWLFFYPVYIEFVSHQKCLVPLMRAGFKMQSHDGRRRVYVLMTTWNIIMQMSALSIGTISLVISWWFGAGLEPHIVPSLWSCMITTTPLYTETPSFGHMLSDLSSATEGPFRKIVSAPMLQE